MNADEIIKKYQLDKKSWTHKGFHGILHFFFSVGNMTVTKSVKDYFGDTHHIAVFMFQDDYGDWYWNDEDMTRMRKLIIDKVDKNPGYLKKLIDDWHRLLRVFDAVMAKIDKTDLAKLSDDEFLDLYEEFYDAYLVEYGPAVVVQDPFSMHADKFLNPHFEKIFKQHGIDFNEDFPLLIAPREDSFLQRENEDRLRLLKEYQSKSPNFEKKLAEHAKKYHWIQNNYAKDTCLDEKYFLQQLKEMKDIEPDQELAKREREEQETIRKKEELVKKLELDQESKNLVAMAETFAYMQDERKKYVLISNHYQNLFLHEIQKRLKLTREEVEYTYLQELRSLFAQKKIDKTVFHERKKACLVINTQEGYEVLSGKVAKEIFDKVFAFKEEGITEIKGITACKGKAQGPVKIVLRISDVANVQQGDILVASMTRPEAVPAMKKAAAFVTDEGGVTSHAAVVSREMNKPCIIGTKVATKVLKDGDIVEVDATTGVVKIIRRVAAE